MSQSVFITGGSRGIGKELVLRFSKAGFNVCFTYNAHLPDAELSASGAFPITADLSSAPGCHKACNEALEKFGAFDVLVNNAGISSQKLFTDISDIEWQEMLNTNLSAPFYITRDLLKPMISRKYGRIINISSMWGVCGASCEVHYSAAKAGLIGMTKALASELAPSGITVNAVAPGVIDTDMYKALGHETMEYVINDIPVGRVGTVYDIARAVIFLASPDASYITGQVLGVNGGMVI